MNPEERPGLLTTRLALRPFTLNDAPMVQKLAGDPAIAATMHSIPHPYEDGMAEKWIETHAEEYKQGKLVNFAIVLRENHQLLGAMGLQIAGIHRKAELGYWIGHPYWGNGYCTEAGRAVVAFGFESLGLNRIFARFMIVNPASGRVMEKIGMKYEGLLRQDLMKEEAFHDMKIYAILKDDYK
nr:GNAT family N-acetyltransferase [candidate division Zixibacteria bacterium]